MLTPKLLVELNLLCLVVLQRKVDSKSFIKILCTRCKVVGQLLPSIQILQKIKALFLYKLLRLLEAIRLELKLTKKRESSII